jgi:uncharacterized protein
VSSAGKNAGTPSQRRETFLARYPRKLKLVGLGVILAILILPWFTGGHGGDAKKTTKNQTSVEGSESHAAIPNPELQSEGGESSPTSSSSINNMQDDRSLKLSPAPDEALSEDTAEGSLPRIGADGRQPWQVYARPFNTADTRPRVAIVVVNLGLSRTQTDAAIARLPVNVTLAFDSQSPVVGAWCSRARQVGHETLLMIPMEPFDYPRSDPGPNTLLTTLPNTDNLIRLQNSMREATGYVGITTISGSRFTTNLEKLDPVLDLLKRRGLMILDAHLVPHSAVPDIARERKIPVAVSVEQLDQNLSPAAIDAALAQLEKTARLGGRAIGVTSAYPIMLDKLQAWTKGLPDRGIALAPVSAMVK